MSEESSPKKEPAGTPKEFRTDYIKSNFFRVIHADGVYGGITPRGLIHIDVWSERPPIPQKMIYLPVSEGGESLELSEQRESRVSREVTTIREVEVGIHLDLDLARNLVIWLQERIEKLEQFNAKHREKT